MIQWYPGHMAKAIREIKENLRFVDLVLVLLDARIPFSSYNPLLKESLQQKKVLFILTKSDLANDVETSKWVKYYEDKNQAIAINSKNDDATKKILQAVKLAMVDVAQKERSKGIKPHAWKLMITGVPNVGKSTLINSLCHKKVARVENRPGVTTAQQWLRINPEVELLDTPGVLWPKFEQVTTGYNLALVGSIKPELLPVVEVCEYFLDFLRNNYPLIFESYFKKSIESTNEELLNNYQMNYQDISKIDYYKLIIQDFKLGKFGKVTLDLYENISKS